MEKCKGLSLDTKPIPWLNTQRRMTWNELDDTGSPVTQGRDRNKVQSRKLVAPTGYGEERINSSDGVWSGNIAIRATSNDEQMRGQKRG